MGKIEEKLKLLPDSPGSYQMLDKDGNIIYVGKAKNLKNRVRSYFHGAHNAKTTLLVSEIDDFRYIICSSELEAYILEINLIKKYDPKYNIMLTDDKTYPYIALSNEEYPRLFVTRNKKKKIARYFGPYPNVKAARSTTNLLNRLYPLRKCFNIPNKPCIYYHLGTCLAPCINKDVDYKDIKNKVASFLNGDVKDILKELEEKMNNSSMNLEFEKAIEYRNLINDINDTVRKQKITINDLTSRDYIAIYEDDEEISINIIITRLGSIVGNYQTIIPLIEGKEDDSISFLLQYYEINEVPHEIAVDGIDEALIENLIKVKCVDVKAGKKKEILDMALYNAKFNLENKRLIFKNTELKKTENVAELGKILGIDYPKRIEAFDNSNLYGEYPVSAMVCYINGKPAPKEYRRYHIKTVEGANDYASMKEVIYRRYLRLLMDEAQMPDLIVMDGGMIQVHAAKEVLDSLNLEIPVLGIQKDDHHKATILFFNEEYINIDKNSGVFLLLADISQKVHDFAISFFRSSKAKGIFSSKLDGIKGLGPKRKELLLAHFMGIENIKTASIDEISSLGIPKDICEAILEKLNEDN